MKAVVYYLKFVSTYCEMKAVVKSNAGLTVEVRNLVIVARSVLDLIPCAQTGESKVPPVLAVYLALVWSCAVQTYGLRLTHLPNLAQSFLPALLPGWLRDSSSCVGEFSQQDHPGIYKCCPPG